MRLFLIILLFAMPIDSCVSRKVAPANVAPVAQPQAEPSPSPSPTPEPIPPCVDSGNGEVSCYPIDDSGKPGR